MAAHLIGVANIKIFAPLTAANDINGLFGAKIRCIRVRFRPFEAQPVGNQALFEPQALAMASMAPRRAATGRGRPARVIDFEAGVAIARTIYAIARSSREGGRSAWARERQLTKATIDCGKSEMTLSLRL